MKAATAMFLALLGAVLIFLASCGKSDAETVSVEVLAAPDGSTCYAIKQGSEVRAGNCR